MTSVTTARSLLATAAVGVLTVSLVTASGAADARTEHRVAAPVAASGAQRVSSVTVANMAFSPASVSTTLGGSVTWTFQDALAHTSTSDQAFWDSGAKLDTTYTHTFTSAGTFAYHCSIHPTMRGNVKVPVLASGSASKGFRLTWATVKASGGITYDVQTRLGSGRWVSFKAATTGAHAKFNPAKAGRYQVRARTAKGGARSGWSTPLSVTIS